MRKHSKEMVEEIMRNWRSGLTYVQVAEKMKEPFGVVEGIIRRNKRAGERSARVNPQGFNSKHQKLVPIELGVMNLEGGKSRRVGTKRTHSEEKVASMLADWRGGISYAEIGRKLQMSPNAAGSIIRRYMTEEDKAKSAKTKIVSPEMIEKIMDGWRSGLTYDEIAERMEETEGVIAGIISRNKREGETSLRKNAFGFSSLHQRLDPIELGILALGDRDKSKMLGATIPRAFSLASFRKCQWIAGEPSKDESCKCGKKTGEGRVYCPRHEIESVRKEEIDE